MGLDRKTVRKALTSCRWPENRPGQRTVRPSKLDSFKESIEARLMLTPSLSAVRIYDEVAKQGYEGRCPSSRSLYTGSKRRSGFGR